MACKNNSPGIPEDFEMPKTEDDLVNYERRAMLAVFAGSIDLEVSLLGISEVFDRARADDSCENSGGRVT